MALNLQHEFTYSHRPVVPIALAPLDRLVSVPTEVLIDTGADVSLFDAELGFALNLPELGSPEELHDLLGIGGHRRRIQFWSIYVSLLAAHDFDPLQLKVGFVPGLGKTVGNLLGRNFLSSFDFCLSHAHHTIYLGLATQ